MNMIHIILEGFIDSCFVLPYVPLDKTQTVLFLLFSDFMYFYQ